MREPEIKKDPEPGEEKYDGGIDFNTPDKAELAREYQAAMAKLEQEFDIHPITREPIKKQSYEGGIDFDQDQAVEGSNSVWEDPRINKDVGKLDWDDKKAA